MVAELLGLWIMLGSNVHLKKRTILATRVVMILIFTEAVFWCVAEGIFEPRNGRLAAWEAATRAELAVMLSRYLTLVGE